MSWVSRITAEDPPEHPAFVSLEAAVRIDDYGVDGNYHHGLPKLVNARDRMARFGGSGDTLVHPGTALPVTVIFAHFSETTEPPDLVLEYEISSADIPPFKNTLLLRGKELLDVD